VYPDGGAHSAQMFFYSVVFDKSKKRERGRERERGGEREGFLFLSF